MIDIHSHIIYGVDDGGKTIEDSLSLLKEEVQQGVTDVICTPHYRRGMFEERSSVIDEHFNEVVECVKKNNLPINLYLGREIYFNHNVMDMIKNGHLKSLNNSGIYLLEFSYTEDTEIDEIVYEMTRRGYKVVIAHIERYQYIKDIEYLYSLKELGAYIQINASTICGANGHKEKKKVFNYLKEGLVDFVASDIHKSRINYMKESMKIVTKKFGEDMAEKIYTTNAKKIFLN